MLWSASPAITTADENAGPKLNLADAAASNDEEADQKDDNGSVDALTKAFDGQRFGHRQGGAEIAQRRARSHHPASIRSVGAGRITKSF